MRSVLIKPATTGAKGEISFLGDKSIAHRAVILGAISVKKTVIRNFPANEDCLSTINVLKKLGVKIVYNLSKGKDKSGIVTVFGAGLYGFKKPKSPVFVGESGTTLRIISGLLAGQNFKITLIAGSSLSKRPMFRLTAPLRLMGADVKARRIKRGVRIEEYPPITIQGGNLKGLDYKIPVASAQVKSALLLAGIYANGPTIVREPLRTRDHTERMLKLFKADIKFKVDKIIVNPVKKLISPGNIYIPGDISSASFFIVLAAIVPGSCLRIKNVCLNSSRTGILKVLTRMKADIKVSGKKSQAGSEPIGDIIVKTSRLQATVIKANEIPFLIDELPVLMVAACFAQGRTVFEGVEELRVKETDRINSMTENLRKMGADIEVVRISSSEKILINGVKELKGSVIRSFGDHRTAMSMIVAAANSCGNSEIDDISCIKKSFPDFLNILKRIMNR